MDEVDRLHWKAFEKLVALLFSRLGYESELVGGKEDHGADVIASRNGAKIAIQVKHRSKKRRDGSLDWIGEWAARAVVAAKPFYDCSKGIVITNSTFAPGMDHVAKVLGIDLWDRERLAIELSSFCVRCGSHVSPKVREWCIERADEFEGRVYCIEHQEPTCVLCGCRVSLKVAEYCLNQPKEFGERIYCFEHQRRFVGVLRTADEPATEID
jgi:restriction system protein